MNNAATATTPADAATSRKGLNLLDSTMLIMGTMIGSGIFIVSAGIAREVGTPALLLLAWVASGIITVFGALSYGELAGMMPKAGGQYVYLREAYGPLFGFLFGWTVFAVIQTGTIAAVGVAFAKFTGVLFPAVSDQPGLLGASPQQWLGIAAIVVLTAVNFLDIKAVARINNVFTFAKIAALVLLILLGGYAMLAGTGSWRNFTAPTGSDWLGNATLLVFGAALVGSLFSSDAWNNITYTAGEVQNPRRNIPLALVLGTGSVCLLYLLCNVMYIYVLPLDAIAAAPADRVGTRMVQELVGGAAGVTIMAIVIMVSTFGCLNGCIVAGSRLYAAMAVDGMFFPIAARRNRNNAPAWSLVLQCAWSCVLVLLGNYNQLLEYIMFAVLIFYVLTALAVFVLRRTQPHVERPYKVWGYPFVPALYILLALGTCIAILVQKTETAQWGLILVLAGIPVYYLFKLLVKRTA